MQPFFEARLDDSFIAERVRTFPPEAIEVPVYPPKERRTKD